MLRQEYPALGNYDSRLWDKRSEAKSGLESGIEGTEIAIVDADQRSIELKSQLELGTVMHLSQDRHAEQSGSRLQCPHAWQVERRDDQQDAIGAQRARLIDLVGIDDEILAKHGKLAGTARSGEVFGATLEETFIGEHGKTSRSVLRVGARNRGGIELFAQQAFARTCLLDFGNHRRKASRDFPAQRSHEVPGR